MSTIYPLELKTFASGQEHNGWIIPDDWTVEKALIRRDGRTLFDGTVHPLAVVQNSPSMRGTFSKAELDKHVFTRPTVPDAYAFHFLNTYRPWNRTWGFCVPHRVWQEWGPGDYEVELATNNRPGTMIVGEATSTASLRKRSFSTRTPAIRASSTTICPAWPSSSNCFAG